MLVFIINLASIHLFFVPWLRKCTIFCHIFKIRLEHKSIILISLNNILTKYRNIYVIIKVYLLIEILLELLHLSFVLILLKFSLSSLWKILNWKLWLSQWFLIVERALDLLTHRIEIEDWWSSLMWIEWWFFLSLIYTIQIWLSNCLLNRLSNICLKYGLIKINIFCLRLRV